MDSLKVADAASQLATDGAESIESLRGDSFSLEVMRFEPGDEDPMHAHGEDEIYQITSGSATINIEGEHVGVEPGDVIHLEPGTEHQFRDFDDELVMTVLYAPAKGNSN